MVDVLEEIDEELGPPETNKLGAIKNFHSLAPQAQSSGVSIGPLRGRVNR